MLSLNLLGPARINYKQQPATQLRSSNAQALLFYLSVERAQGNPRHSRQALMDLLWPNTLPQSAQTSLRQTLYQLQKSIPTVVNQQADPIPLLLSDRQFVQLNPEGQIDLDVAKFQHLAASDSITNLRKAADLYRGDFLADFSLPDSNPFELWAESQRESLRRTMLKTLTSLVERTFQEENYSLAEQYARRQIEIDNLSEQGHQHLMQILALSQRSSEALRHYDGYRQLLDNELNLEPSANISDLAESIRLGDGVAVSARIAAWTLLPELKGSDLSLPVVDELAQITNNLPLYPMPFIGRKAELKMLAEMLADTQIRLLTITGLGGIGKTRLALAVAEGQIAESNFQDGVFFVPLAGLNEIERISSVIAEALKLTLEFGEDQLVAHLQDLQILLVLDNFEHLLDGRDLVLRILQAAPKVKILATSRERLNLQSEQVFLLQGFPVADDAVMDDARQLFIQTARRLHPDFRQTAEDLPVLNRICRLVDGMPLALELAAAWTDVLSPADIAAEIQANLDILETDFRDIPERHHSMRAVFDATWQNLSTSGQQLLSQLSVFRGGFTRQAAAAVCQASPRDLAGLVKKSLLKFEAASNRYSMHELLRQYSEVRLAQVDARDRHSAYFLDWLVLQGKKMLGGEPGLSAAQIEREMDNIRTAVLHALRSRKLNNFDQVIRTLGQFYTIQDLQHEGASFLGLILEQLSAHPGTPKLTLFWVMAWRINLLDVLLKLSESQLETPKLKTLLADLALKDIDLRAEQAFLYFIEGYQQYFHQPVKARQLLQRSYELQLEIDDRWLPGYTLMGIARAARNQWDMEGAQAAATASLALFRASNDQSAIGRALCLIGSLAGIGGRYVEAERWLQEGIAIARRMNRLWTLVIDGGLEKLRMVYFFSGRFEEALLPNLEYSRLSEKYGYAPGMIMSKISQGQLCVHLGRYSEAIECCEATIHQAQKYGFNGYAGEALKVFSQIGIANGDAETARMQIDEADRLLLPYKGWTSRYVAGIPLYRGILASITGKTSDGWVPLKAELITALQHKDLVNLANCLAAAALLKAREADGTAAIELYALARQHPFVAQSLWFADVIGKEIEQAARNLPTTAIQAAQARGRDLDMWETAKNLLLPNIDPDL